MCVDSEAPCESEKFFGLLATLDHVLIEVIPDVRRKFDSELRGVSLAHRVDGVVKHVSGFRIVDIEALLHTANAQQGGRIVVIVRPYRELQQSMKVRDLD